VAVPPDDLLTICQADLRRHAVVLVAISTTGQGDLPSNAQSFWKALRSARLVAGSLSGVRFAAFGLGDSSYPKYVHRTCQSLY
jgi:sulfite reductase alpha subunit-like flavoprotein